MNIHEIESAIQELEADDLTLSNARNLASLYIIYNNMQKAVRSQNMQSDSNLYSNTNKELYDILPAYTKYREIKTKYQLHELPEEALVPAMKLVVQELKEFLSILYNTTHLRKERICIESMVSSLYNQFELADN